MDAKRQTNHLKAYGIAFAALAENIKVDWLLNYRGGSYGMEHSSLIEKLCIQRGVAYTVISNKDYKQIIKELKDKGFNGAVKQLEKMPKIAVYTPPNKQPWDDAVTLALTYAEVPFEKIYVGDVLNGNLDKYDWVHLFHEDFTGQYGKFWINFKQADWYIKEQQTAEGLAAKYGFKKVSQMQLAVAKKLRDFVVKGGNMFAMCSATESFDIALSAEGMDICEAEFDNDGIDMKGHVTPDYTNCLAFTNFTPETSPYRRQLSDIDNYDYHGKHLPQNVDFFYLYPFNAKENIVSAMLCQNHTDKINGFMGQTTGFRKAVLKSDVTVLGMTALPYVPSGLNPNFKDKFQQSPLGGIEATSNSRINEDGTLEYLYSVNEARYIHSDYGKGSWTFYAGHDPEDYSHLVGDPATDLDKYRHSPGYRLILNNILSPAAKRDPVPTIVYGEHATPAAAKQGNAELSPTNQLSLLMYPNPTDKDIIITFKPGTGALATSKKIEHVVVMNAEGRVFINQNYDQSQVKLDLSSYPSGLYLVQVNGVYSGNIIKN